MSRTGIGRLILGIGLVNMMLVEGQDRGRKDFLLFCGTVSAHRQISNLQKQLVL